MSINVEDFKTKLTYPSRPVRPEILGKKISDVSVDDLAAAMAAKTEYDLAMAAYDEAKKAYNADEARLEAEFKSALEVDHGISGHPNADKLYSIAWSYGHSAGLGEVVTHYNELADLVVGTKLVSA